MLKMKKTSLDYFDLFCHFIIILLLAYININIKKHIFYLLFFLIFSFYNETFNYYYFFNF